MNFLAMQFQLLGRAHEDSTNAGVLRDRAKEFLNLARHKLVGWGPWHFLMKTGTVPILVDTREVELAEDLQHLNDREVWLGLRAKRLYPLLDQDFELACPDLTLQDVPKWFRTAGTQKLQLYPKPSATAVTTYALLTYEYAYRFTTDLALDADLSGLPLDVEPVMLDLAEVYIQAYSKRLDLAQLAWSQAVAGLQKLWQENSEILRLEPRDIPPALKQLTFQQVMSEVNRT